MLDVPLAKQEKGRRGAVWCTQLGQRGLSDRRFEQRAEGSQRVLLDGVCACAGVQQEVDEASSGMVNAAREE